MKLVRQSAKLMIQFGDMEKFLSDIARVCYQSEGGNSILKTRIFDAGHWSIFEHVNVCLKADRYWIRFFEGSKYISYFKYQNEHYLRGNLRAFIEWAFVYSGTMQSHEILHFINKEICHFEWLTPLLKNGYYNENRLQIVKDFSKFPSDMRDRMETRTIALITNRKNTHRIVRHRVGSFIQESTRSCNYAKERFGKELTFIVPSEFRNEAFDKLWYVQCERVESSYNEAIELGCTAEEAGLILNDSIKSEIIVTMTVHDWKEFLKKRGNKHNAKEMRELTILISQILS